MSTSNHMPISHRLEVITGQLTLIHHAQNDPKATLNCKRYTICSMRVALVFSHVFQIGVHDWTRECSAYATFNLMP